MPEFVKVAKKSEIPADMGKAVEVNGREIALFKIGGKLCAIDSICPHQGGPLAEGGIDGNIVMCPWHGWSFDATTGECTFNPAIKVDTFPVKEQGDDILIQA